MPFIYLYLFTSLTLNISMCKIMYQHLVATITAQSTHLLVKYVKSYSFHFSKKIVFTRKRRYFSTLITMLKMEYTQTNLS
jgi:hypothetical protein